MHDVTVTSFTPREDPRNVGHYRREKTFWKETALIDLDKGAPLVHVRFYGAASTVYCVVWLRTYEALGASARGCGKASGWGYHKPSAALQEALAAAGVTLSEDIGGRGDELIRAAMLAIAEHLAIARPYIHDAHA